MADWKRIEAEYITTETSYRKLAQKYGLNQATIAQRAKAEDWVGKRKRQASTTQAKIIGAVEGQKVNRAVRLQRVADKLLDKVEQILDEPGGVASGSLRNISATLRDIKEIQMIRPELDVKEQEARIANLQKQAEKDERNASVTVTLEGELAEYAR